MTTIDLPQPHGTSFTARARSVVAVRAARVAAWWRASGNRSVPAPAYDRFFGHFGLTNPQSPVVAQLFDAPPTRSRIRPMERQPRRLELEI